MPTFCTTQSPVLHTNFCRELVKELITSSGIFPSLTPRGRPRRLAVGLTRLQAGYHFPEKIQDTRKRTNITRSCAVCFPGQKNILARTGEKRKRPGKVSSFQCTVCKVALYTSWTAFSCTTLFRAKSVSTMRIMIMPMMTTKY